MTYEEIANNEHLAEKILKDCYFSADEPIKKWEIARNFISETIKSNGAILDIGCANGFLLKSLQSWTGCDLVPFGVDILEKNILNAKNLFPDQQNNFVTLSFEDFIINYPNSFPEVFDYICWSFWDDSHLITKTEIDFLLSHVKDGGKLIITFYPDNSKEPTDTIGNIPNVLQMGYKAKNIRNSAPGRNEQLLVIEK